LDCLSTSASTDCSPTVCTTFRRRARSPLVSAPSMLHETGAYDGWPARICEGGCAAWMGIEENEVSKVYCSRRASASGDGSTGGIVAPSRSSGVSPSVANPADSPGGDHFGRCTGAGITASSWFVSRASGLTASSSTAVGRHAPHVARHPRCTFKCCSPTLQSPAARVASQASCDSTSRQAKSSDVRCTFGGDVGLSMS